MQIQGHWKGWLRRFFVWAIILTGAMHCSARQASSNSQPSLLGELQGQKFSDCYGKIHSAADWSDKRALVFIFLAIDCPVSNRYSPELNSIYSDYAQQGIAIYGVHSDDSVTEGEARAHAREYSLNFPVLLDPSFSLAKLLGAKMTPEAVVLSRAGVPLYRGRIDNLYISFGQMRAEPTVKDLRTVLDNIVNGKSQPYRFNAPVGCFIPFSR